MMASGLDVLFNPRSIAVIGASREEKSVGYGVLKNLLSGGIYDSGFCKPFPGKVYAVNPKAAEILGVKCFPSITAVPDVVDVAVIAVPAKIVPQVMEECASKGVRGAIIVSAGFAESGAEGKALQDKVLETARKAGMRVLGPNCLGIVRPPLGLNASFAPSMPRAGSVAFVTQSGALADSLIDWAIKERYAFSAIVSIGNSADVDASDVIEWCCRDEATKTIAVYLESIVDGEKFMRVAKEAAKSKPIILLKGGRTSAGAQAAKTHTGGMAGDYAIWRAACRQTGVSLAESFEELFDTAKILAQQPRAKSNAVAIVTNGGGAGVLCADYCSELGVNIVPLKKETVDKLDASGVMHPAWSRANPVDIVGDALPERYKAAVNTLLAEDYVAGLIVIQTLQTMTDPLGDAMILTEARKKFPDKPIVGVFMGGRFVRESVEFLEQSSVPDFNDPRKAARAMAALVGRL
jgi:acetyltransferase